VLDPVGALWDGSAAAGFFGLCEAHVQDLFRYMEWRSPRAGDAGSDVIVVAGSSPFRDDLRHALTQPNPAQALAQVAGDFAGSSKYALPSSGLKLDGAYEQAARLAHEWRPDGPALAKKLMAAFAGKPLTDVVASADFTSDRTRMHDSLIAVKILGSERHEDAPLLIGLARAIHVVENAAQADPLTTTPDGVARLLEALIVLPEELFAIGRAAPSGGTSSPTVDTTEALSALRTRRERLQAALNYLASLGSDTLRPIELEDAVAAGDDDAGVGFWRRLWRWLLRLFGIRTPTAGSSAGHEQPHATLSEEALARIPEGVRAVLAELHADPARMPLPAVVGVIVTALAEVEERLLQLEPFQATPVYQLGQSFFTLTQPTSPTFLGTAPQVKIQPVGFGDLQVVKQQIVRYEPGEVSYIENVMRGEHYDREIRRREMEEEISVTERERIKEEERDLQATDRFELHTQSEATSRDTTSTTSGNTVTSHYGSFVDTHGSTFARDVVNRAVNRLTERVREQRTIRLQRELVEKTVHGFENRDGTGQHISGTYQWVDKIYQAQIYNFGKRLLYEAVIPEPAAFVIAMRKKSGQPEGTTLSKPPEPSFSPGDLQAWNYLTYAKTYGVVGAVEPPPDAFVSVTKPLEAASDNQQYISQVDSIPIPEGYSAWSVANCWINRWGVINKHMALMLGGRDILIHPGLLPGETDALPFSVFAVGYDRVLTHIMVFCQRRPEHLEKWQIRTYEALLRGYQRQLDRYEEQLANVQALARSQMLLSAGQGANRETERVELKRAFLTLLTNQHFDAFGAISTSAAGYPETDISAAVDQAGFITFFERAFEWENMLYFFYPYFWGRKGQWGELAFVNDPDPQFEAFLKAGAARVVVPVRPGFEAALAHYVETGQVWLGAEEPNMYSPLFVSILQEIKDRDKAPGEETPVGKPWEVRLPTTLVLLREQTKLPAWQRDAAGKWVPVP
jgi:hypothetical protein